VFFLLKPCRSSAAYEAIPTKKVHLDIDTVQLKLEEHYDIVLNAGIMLVIEGLCEVSIHRSGKFIIKTDSEELAKQEAERIYGLLG